MTKKRERKAEVAAQIKNIDKVQKKIRSKKLNGFDIYVKKFLAGKNFFYFISSFFQSNCGVNRKSRLVN